MLMTPNNGWISLSCVSALCVRTATVFLFLRWNSRFDSPLLIASATLQKPGRTGHLDTKQF
jgi:hypothetical protein